MNSLYQLLPVLLSITAMAQMNPAPTVQLSRVTQKQTWKWRKKSIAIVASSRAAFSATIMFAAVHKKCGETKTAMCVLKII